MGESKERERLPPSPRAVALYEALGSMPPWRFVRAKKHRGHLMCWLLTNDFEYVYTHIKGGGNE